MLRTEYIVFLVAFVATYLGVSWFRVWTLKKGYLDHPNERSSHEIPTPRGGGLVIAAATIASYIGCSWLFDYKLSIGFIVGGLLIVAVSWLDDIYSLSFAWRLLVHLTAAAVLVFDVGYFESAALPFVETPIYVGGFGLLISLIWIAWFLNAYNFMDGIDGIAGVQAIGAGMGWMIVGYLLGVPAATIVGGVVVFSSVGFLIHNWQPAKIFMGDAGSAFLGYTFASMPFLIRGHGNSRDALLPVIAVLFVWLFVFDSALTLFRRLLRRERVWTPHREHLYQRLVISGLSHQSVSLYYGLSAIAIALPAAFMLNERIGFADLISLITVLLTTVSLVIFVRSYE